MQPLLQGMPSESRSDCGGRTSEARLHTPPVNIDSHFYYTNMGLDVLCIKISALRHLFTCSPVFLLALRVYFYHKLRRRPLDLAPEHTVPAERFLLWVQRVEEKLTVWRREQQSRFSAHHR